VLKHSTASNHQSEKGDQSLITILPQRGLRELLHYDPDTGIFTRLVAVSNVHVGDVAGRTADTRGYVAIGVNGRLSRRLRGDVPTIDLVVGYNKANASPILKLFLSRVDDLVASVSRKRH
jgi:hypothetical protein